jgi:hypothetical protein
LQINHNIVKDELQTAQEQLNATKLQSDLQIKHLRERNELQKEAEILIIRNIKKQKCDFMTEQNKLMINSGDITKNIMIEVDLLNKDLDFEKIN